MAAAYRVDARRWSALFGELMDPIEARFSRPQPRRRVRDFVAGLLAPLPSKNCWTIAEHAGDDNPGGMQDLIGRASWDDALVRADVRDFVGRRLGHPDAILVIDETGDLKKGRHTVAVQRQYSGTAGKIENCQLAVHLTYASPLGHALVDVALYLPRSWSDDPQRRAEAGVPEGVGFATKPQLARRLIETAVAGGLLCRWVTGDEAYGGDPALATACASSGSAMSWRSPVLTEYRPASGSNAPTRLLPACPNGPGRGGPPARARRVTATTTGHSSVCLWPRIGTPDTTGCWSAATAVGAVLGDLAARRGQISGSTTRAGTVVITATVPLVELFGYATRLRSRSQGRATFTTRPAGYLPAPDPAVEEGRRR